MEERGGEEAGAEAGGEVGCCIFIYIISPLCLRVHAFFEYALCGCNRGLGREKRRWKTYRMIRSEIARQRTLWVGSGGVRDEEWFHRFSIVDVV